MIIQEMVYQFKLQAERVDSKKSPDLSLAKIIIFLNSAQLNLVKTKSGINNLFRQGFEASQKRKQDLQKITIFGEKIEPLENDDEHSDLFRFDLTRLKHEVLAIERVKFKATDCGVTDYLVGVAPQTDDMNIIDQSAFSTPSFEWRETNYRISEDQLFADGDGFFTIDSAYIDYLRFPTPMDIVGYKHFDGTASTNVDCELKFPGEIIDQAALEFKLSLGDPNYQFARVKQSVNE